MAAATILHRWIEVPASRLKLFVHVGRGYAGR
jgi:hypothetical protein